MIKLHANDLITVIQIHTNNTHRAPACCPDICFLKAYTHTMLCYKENLCIFISDLNLDQFIIISQADCCKTILTYIHILHNTGLLRNTIFCDHEEILIFFKILDRNDSCYLFSGIHLQKVYDRRSS